MKKGAYGIVYQEIMRSPDLPGNSKLIYAYLAAFAGNGDECYPSVETICKELGMTKTTMYKYMNMLVEYGVIEKKQTYVGNLKSRVIYRITHEVALNVRVSKISESGESISLVSEKIGIRIGENPSESERNINNTNSNNIKNNSNKKYMCVQPEVDTTTKSTPKEKRARFIPPTEEEVNQYCLEKGYMLDAQRFVDFYECKGWMVGKNKMKNWKAAVRTWVNKNQGVAKNRPKPQPKEPEEKRIDLWSEE